MFFPIKDYRRSHAFPWVTIALISLNVIVFLLQALILGDSASRYAVIRGGELAPLTRGEIFLFQYGVTPCEILGSCEPVQVFDTVQNQVVSFRQGFPQIPFPVWLTFFTSMFLHGGLLHLASNMWFLWIFGDNVEDAMGRPRYLLFYLISGWAAAWAQIAIGPSSQVPMVGASGAIAGVLGAYMVLYPRGRILTLMWVLYFLQFIELPAIIVLGFWFVLQLLSAIIGAGMLSGGGVAWMAHVGGFIAGALLVRFLVRRQPRPTYSSWR